MNRDKNLKSSWKNKNKSPSILERKYKHYNSEGSAQDQFDIFLSSVGNQQVARFFEGGQIQAKLDLSNPGDTFEQQADRIADQMVQMKPNSEALLPKIDSVQAKGNSSGDVPDSTENGIKQLSGKGSNLSKPVREFFEPHLGVDLGNVKVHTGSNANALARSVNARAFTYQNEIVFGKGEYQPETTEGKKLIGHELVHTVQQGGGVQREILQRELTTEALNNPIVRVETGNHLDDDSSMWIVVEFRHNIPEKNLPANIEQLSLAANESFPRRQVYYFYDTQLSEAVQAAFSYMPGWGWEKSVYEGALGKVRLGNHDDRSQMTLEVSDDAQFDIQTVASNPSQDKGPRLIFKVSGETIDRENETNDAELDAQDYTEYIQFWVDKLSPDSDWSLSLTIAQLNASKGTMVERFGDVNTFFSTLQRYFDQTYPDADMPVIMEGNSFKTSASLNRYSASSLTPSTSLANFLKNFEQFSSHMYNDAGNHATIGYGHLIHRGPINGSQSESPFKNGITEAEASALFNSDVIDRAAKFVRAGISVPLTQYEFDALVSFTFNVGGGNFNDSNIRTIINSKDWSSLAAAWRLWRVSGGKVKQGLVNRREDELEMFYNGDYIRNH